MNAIEREKQRLKWIGKWGSIATAIILAVYIVQSLLFYISVQYVSYTTRFEVKKVHWGHMVNRSYEPETARWINFTIFNYGPNSTDETHPFFKLKASFDGDYVVIDQRYWIMSHGLNEIKMMARTIVINYQLIANNKTLWQGKPED